MVKYGQYTKGYGNILTAGYGAMFWSIAHQLLGFMTKKLDPSKWDGKCLHTFGIQTK